MLFFSLIASAILLLVVNVAYFRKSSPSLDAAVLGIILGIGPIFLGCIVPLVALQAFLLFVGSLVCVSLQSRARYFFMYSCLATIGIYSWVGVHRFRDLEALRARYPLESLARRLPSRPPVVTTGPLTASTVGFLTSVEEHVSYNPFWRRMNSLQRLHGDKVTAFISSPGFGMSRMPYLSAGSLAVGLREEKSIPQPGRRDTSSLSSEQIGLTPLAVDFGPLNRLHVKGFLDFVNPIGFGWLTERKQMAGFQAHRFSEVPDATPWSVQTLELLGLVVHEQPVVYVSENLPRMSELREAPTRSLDNFELAGLEALRAGQNIFVRTTLQGLRMLGGVRAATECIKCHSGERGELLGAFSYALRDANELKNGR